MYPKTVQLVLKIMRIGIIVKAAIILIVIFLCPSLLFAKREHPEKWYQKRWCREQGGRIEVVLPDRTRCDCVGQHHFDPRSVGQHHFDPSARQNAVRLCDRYARD